MMNRRVRVACSCGSHIYPDQSKILDSVFTDDSEDWWIEEECKRCKDTCIFGGRVVEHTKIMGGPQRGKVIMRPEYV